METMTTTTTELTHCRLVAKSTLRRTCDALDHASRLMTSLSDFFARHDNEDHPELRQLSWELWTMSDELRRVAEEGGQQ